MNYVLHKIQSHTPDTENPAWTAEDFKQARPAREVLPGIFSKARAEALLSNASSDWQTRIDAALRQYIPEHPSTD